MQGIGQVVVIQSINQNVLRVNKNIIQLDSRIQVRHGFSGDLPYPTLTLSLSVCPELMIGERLHAINACLADALHLPEIQQFAEDDRIESLLEAFLFWVHELQIAAYWPVFVRGHIISDDHQEGVFGLAIPVVKYGHGPALKIVEWCSSVFNCKFSGQSLAPLLGQLQPLIATLRAVAPNGSNSGKFLKAAFERNPVSVEGLKGLEVEQAYKMLLDLPDDSVYSDVRLAQPDEVWNFKRGDGIEKAILLANIILNKNFDGNLDLVVENNKVVLNANDKRYEFITKKELIISKNLIKLETVI